MSHGKPDWGLVGPKTTVYGSDDMGELAVRLNSPVMWDRRGDVILMDSMEDGGGLRFASTGGVGDYYTTRAGLGRHGPLAHFCWLQGAFGSDGEVHWWVFPTGQLVLGFEISWGYVINLLSLEFNLRWYDGVIVHECNISYLPATGTLRYRTAAAAWTNIVVGLVLMPIAYPYHVIKIVADFDTNEHVRVILNENTYNLPGIALYDAANGFGPLVEARMTVVSDLVGPSSFTADRVILTQNEPL